MLKENLLLENYAGHFEAAEIEPSRELVYFLCSNSLELFNDIVLDSEKCECGENMSVYKIVDRIPVGKFEELFSIVAIHLYFCSSCKKWKLDFIG
ncbi:hypothetical protein [Bacillus pacificus]|uniref:hypothetical protein n=1 Tax=Bacillus pacificus TaxID=2026187 RepID=UPI0021D07D25|nr:hypothetical protein [Bacillus pacificus]MCU5732823.1 hypothetical protein [Bacillus pacificus]